MIEFDARGPLRLNGHWEPGPKPFSFTDRAVPTRPRATADIDARATYFSPRACRALYGKESASERDRPWLRWWRSARDEDAEGAPGGLGLEALEVLRFRFAHGQPDCLLAIHASLPEQNPIGALETAALLPDGSQSREWYTHILDDLGDLSPTFRRATTLAFVVAASSPMPLPINTPPLDSWTASDQWLWHLASATTHDRYPPDPARREELVGSQLVLSADWRALVLRDGVGFVGMRPENVSDPLDFFRSAETHFRALYLDALLLGMIQRLALSQVADEIARTDDPAGAAHEVLRLERELTKLRNVYWWQHVSRGHANQLLRAYSQQHGLPELLSQVLAEVNDYARQVQTAAAARTQALLGFVTVVGLPFGLALALAQATGHKHFAWVGVALSIAAVAALVLLIPFGRAILQGFPRGRRHEKTWIEPTSSISDDA